MHMDSKHTLICILFFFHKEIFLSLMILLMICQSILSKECFPFFIIESSHFYYSFAIFHILLLLGNIFVMLLFIV